MELRMTRRGSVSNGYCREATSYIIPGTRGRASGEARAGWARIREPSSVVRSRRRGDERGDALLEKDHQFGLQEREFVGDVQAHERGECRVPREHLLERDPLPVVHCEHDVSPVEH